MRRAAGVARAAARHEFVWTGQDRTAGKRQRGATWVLGWGSPEGRWRRSSAARRARVVAMRALSSPRCFVTTSCFVFSHVLLPRVVWVALRLYVGADSRGDAPVGVSSKGDGATSWMALELVVIRASGTHCGSFGLCLLSKVGVARSSCRRRLRRRAVERHCCWPRWAC